MQFHKHLPRTMTICEHRSALSLHHAFILTTELAAKSRGSSLAVASTRQVDQGRNDDGLMHLRDDAREGLRHNDLCQIRLHIIHSILVPPFCFAISCLV